MLLVGQRKFCNQKLRILYHGQKELRLEKVIKRKWDTLYPDGKAMIIYLIVGLTKKTLYKMSQYFPKPYEPSGGEINIKVNLSNYATKTDSKKAAGIDTSNINLVSKSNLAKLIAEADIIDVDKLKMH